VVKPIEELDVSVDKTAELVPEDAELEVAPEVADTELEELNEVEKTVDDELVALLIEERVEELVTLLDEDEMDELVALLDEDEADELVALLDEDEVEGFATELLEERVDVEEARELVEERVVDEDTGLHEISCSYTASCLYSHLSQGIDR